MATDLRQLYIIPSYFLSTLARLINNLVFSDNSYATNQEQSDDKTYFFVNADDARQQVPAVHDIAHLVTIVMQALKNNIDDKYAPEHQFCVDFIRASKIIDNGKELAKGYPEEALTRWSSEVARNNNLPVEAIRAAICALNQNIGNAAVNLLYNLHGKIDQQPIIYRTLMHSSLMKHVLKRDGDKISIYYTIPLQAINPDAAVDEKFDPESPDVVLRSSLTIQFSDYFAYKACEQGNPDFVTNSTTLQQLNPAITFEFDRYMPYIERECDDFLLLAPNPEIEMRSDASKPSLGL